MELTSGAAIGYTGGLVWTQSSFYMDMESWRPMGHGHGHVQLCMVMDIMIWAWAWAWWLRNVCAHGGLTYTSLGLSVRCWRSATTCGTVYAMNFMGSVSGVDTDATYGENRGIHFHRFTVSNTVYLT